LKGISFFFGFFGFWFWFLVFDDQKGREDGRK